MSLTASELKKNTESYSTKDKNGNDFILGKLVKIEEKMQVWGSDMINLYKLTFENMPPKEILRENNYTSFNPDGVNPMEKMFTKLEKGGKRKYNKSKKGRKQKSRKSNKSNK
jgi:hypothetical protein